MARRIGKRLPKPLPEHRNRTTFGHDVSYAVKKGKLIRTLNNSEFHHWSYNWEHKIDCIELTTEDHNKIHQYLNMMRSI